MQKGYMLFAQFGMVTGVELLSKQNEGWQGWRQWRLAGRALTTPAQAMTNSFELAPGRC
jgi:hypothetical protein